VRLPSYLSSWLPPEAMATYGFALAASPAGFPRSQP